MISCFMIGKSSPRVSFVFAKFAPVLSLNFFMINFTMNQNMIFPIKTFFTERTFILGRSEMLIQMGRNIQRFPQRSAPGAKITFHNKCYHEG